RDRGSRRAHAQGGVPPGDGRSPGDRARGDAAPRLVHPARDHGAAALQHRLNGRTRRSMTPSPPVRPADAVWRRRFAWAFAAAWAALAVNPAYRADWALENLLVAAGALLLFGLRKRAPLSAGAALAVFLFACLHALGAHYTYS